MDKIEELKKMLPSIQNSVSDLRKESTKSLCGPCPKCGGDDRFVYRTDSKRFFCRQCNEKGGDLLDFHVWLNGHSVKDLLNKYLPDSKPVKTNSKPFIHFQLGKPVKKYPYTDASGKVLYWNCRFEPKTFRQCSADGLSWKVKGIKKVPYNLPKVIESNEVFIPEGEKDCHSLAKLNLVGSCNVAGAGNWTEDLNEYFKGKDVFLIPDNDEPGRKHVAKVYENLKGIAASIKLIELPGLPERGDFSDWLDTFNDDLETAAERFAIMVEGAEILRDVILQGAQCQKADSSPQAKNGKNPYNKKILIEGVNIASTFSENTGKSTPVNKSQQSQQMFIQGTRDEALFHLVNCLVKGGMQEETIRNYLLFFALNCKPPFSEKEAITKIKSALKRKNDRSKNLTAEIREIIESTSGNFSSTFIYQTSTKSTFPEDKRKISAILSRMVKEGYIERVNNQNGLFRRIESDCKPEDWQNACTDTVDLWLPFELSEMIEVPPGSIILFAGSQDAGKSAVQMNIAKENRHTWDVHYYSSELNAGAFKNRMNKFPDLSIDQCSINFYPRSSNFHDVLKTGKNDLNIIDYLEIHDNFYKVSEYLAQIHKKLGDSTCVVALQKDPQALYGRGGSFTQEKPILSVALDYGKATISKFKGEFKNENPRGKQYLFKLVDGCRIVKGSGWHRPPPK